METKKPLTVNELGKRLRATLEKARVLRQMLNLSVSREKSESSNAR